MLFKRKKKKSRKERLAGTVKTGIGFEPIKAGWSIIRSPLDIIRQNRKSGEDPELLKEMSFKELMAHWGIPLDKIPRLKRTLIFEMIAYIALTGLGCFSVGYYFLSPEKRLYSILFGILVILIAIVQFLFRHHWYMILARQKYFTFREYLGGGKG